MSKRILIVDDERVSRALLQKVFQQETYEVTSVDDGRRGIAAYLSSLSGNAFDLIILDISMPVADGFMALKKIREEEESRGIARGNERAVPVFMVTADNESRGKAFELGCTEYITKPFDRDFLLNKVKEILA